MWKEREENALILIRTARYGRRELYAAKLLVFLAGAAGIVILFYGINLLEAVKFVGLGNPGRSIQSLDGYLASPFHITAGRYLLFFSGVCRNSLGAMAFSSVCLLLPLILHMLGVVESRGILQLLLGFYGV